MRHIKGDGVFKIRNNKIYVHGTINGKFYRKSTGKNATPANKAWLKRQDPLKVLSEILGVNRHGQKQAASLREIAEEALQLQYESRKITEEHNKDKIRALENIILPYFENIAIEDITAKNIVDFLNSLKEKYSYTRVKFIKNLFKSIFNYAKNDLRVIDYSPFDSENVKSIDLSWNVTTEVYTTEEVAKILENATGWFKVFLDLSIKYGFRPGENLVIKWSDINLEHGILQIQRSINIDNVIVEHKNKKGNKNHFRTISLFESTIELLKNYKEVRPNNEWLFVNKNNKPFIQSQSIIDYHLKPLLKELNIKYKTLYALRRSFASIMKFSVDNLEEIQQIMGHAKGSDVTEKHYISDNILTVEDRKSQARRQEQLFNALVQSN